LINSLYSGDDYEQILCSYNLWILKLHPRNTTTLHNSFSYAPKGFLRDLAVLLASSMPISHSHMRPVSSPAATGAPLNNLYTGYLQDLNTLHTGTHVMTKYRSVGKASGMPHDLPNSHKNMACHTDCGHGFSAFRNSNVICSLLEKHTIYGLCM
jgi:hypothetical protein